MRGQGIVGCPSGSVLGTPLPDSQQQETLEVKSPCCYATISTLFSKLHLVATPLGMHQIHWDQGTNFSSSVSHFIFRVPKTFNEVFFKESGTSIPRRRASLAWEQLTRGIRIPYCTDQPDDSPLAAKHGRPAPVQQFWGV